MTQWNPEEYLHYADERLRPALDLLRQIPLRSPRRAVDLGCGPGTVTKHLAERFPGAVVLGIDNSPEMLTKAAKIKGVTWQKADIATWAPVPPVDLIFSNAALHWLPDHGVLFPSLMGGLEPGGVLAVQMPHNQAAPSHTYIAETVADGPWRERLEPLLTANAVEDPVFYYDLLAGLCSRLSIWETEYLHVLDGANPVVNWTKGSALKGFLDGLSDDGERRAFIESYGRRIARAYPRRSDGRTLMPFKRLFILAQIHQ